MDNNQPIIPVMHCFDNNYVIPAAVSFYSMLENANKKYHYILYVLSTDITPQNKEKLSNLVHSFDNAELQFIDMHNKFDKEWKELKNTSHLSKEVLYKLLVAEIFPQYDKIIITDVDVVFQGDISPSYFSFDPDDSVYFAGVRQTNPDKTFLRDYYENYKRNFSDIEFYQLKICGGFLVANLKKQRLDKIYEVFTAYMNNNSDRLLQAEQDVINFCCRAKEIVYLPLNYVVCSYMYDICKNKEIRATDPYYTYNEICDAMDHPIQLHYATSVKPWKNPKSIKADIWFNYLSKTEFVKDYQIKYVDSEVRGKKYRLSKSSENPTCSVIMCTYNHSRYIARALDSIARQETSYSFELIVADDASNDGTQDIIKEFKKNHSSLVMKCILREENVGIGHNYYEALSLAEGKYLAICDGDDYWNCTEKLQKQIDFLEENEDYSMVCSDFLISDDDTGEKNIFGLNNYLKNRCGIKDYYSRKDLLDHRFIASCTLMLRWTLKNSVPEFIKFYHVIDFPLELIHSYCGKIKVFQDALSTYHIHSSSITSQNKDVIIQECDKLITEVCNYIEEHKEITNITLEEAINEKQYEVGIIKKIYKLVVPLGLRNKISPIIHKFIK